MVRYGGIGLSANQIGLPFRMFIMGGHPLVEEGKVRQCWNPEIVESSKEKVLMKEGCLTFPWLFLSIKRPSWVKVKYENDDKESVEEPVSEFDVQEEPKKEQEMIGQIWQTPILEKNR